MRISEIRAREDIDAILHRTLSSMWSQMLGATVRVDATSRPGQHWVEHPVLSVFLVHGAARDARRWAADAFRFTPRAVRAPAQWLLGTATATALGVRAVSRPGFTVAPDVPDARRLVLVPGNRRLRLIDLAAGRTFSVLKDGFSTDALRREAALRNSAGPWVPVLRLHESPQVSWLEEPLIDGWALPRCPPGVDRRRAERLAIEQLRDWLTATTEPTHSGNHAESLAEHIRRDLMVLDARHGSALAARLAPTIAALVERAARLGTTTTAISHGDLQPGNVMVRRGAGRRPTAEDVVLIDWEYAARRFSAYDGLCLGLAARARAKLADRVVHFVEEGTRALAEPARALLSDEPRERSWRSAASALFLLEDLAWLTADAAVQPFKGISEPLLTLTRELTRFGAQLTGLP